MIGRVVTVDRETGRRVSALRVVGRTASCSCGAAESWPIRPPGVGRVVEAVRA